MKKLILTILIFISACASTEKPQCASIDEEPISVCRAKKECETAKRNVGVGVGFGIGGNVGIGVGHRVPSTRYEDCLDGNLKEQEATAKLKKSTP
ncbi:MAG: hypothetical protein AB7O96_09120 [Pseudobdellovibrionaceae bacterium]